MEQLKVGIGADTKGLEKGLKDAEKALKVFSNKSAELTADLKKNAIASSKLGTEISKLNQDFKKGTVSQDRYDKEMKDLLATEKKLSTQSKTLRSDLSKLNASTKDLGSKGFNTARKGAANAVPAVTEFSRVIQDAPFGIQGVANNITQLTQQFGYLKASTGSTSAALKSMLTTLTGPAGMLFAISAITSLWVAYEHSQQGAEKSTNKLVDSTKDLIGSAKTEISTLNTLLSIAKDDRRSRRERQLAVNKLQELYPSYLKNITLEGVNSVNTSKNVDTLTKSLLQQAKVKGLQTRLSELYAKQYEVENKKITEQISTIRLLWTGIKNYGNVAKSSMEAAEIATKNQKEELSELNNQIQKIQGTINGIVSSGVDFNSIFGGGNKNSITKSLQDDTFVPAIESVKTFKLDLQKEITEEPLQGGFQWRNIFNYNQLQEEQLKITQSLEQFNQQSKMIIAGSLSQTFSQLGTAIGNALTEGGNVLSAIGTTILQGLAGFIGKMGDLLIKYGTLAIIKGKLDIAIATGGPAAIAAGLAAVAVGVALKAASAGISSLASSGGSSGSEASNTGSNYSPPRSFGGSSSFGNGGRTVVFEIAGQKLVGVLSNTLRQNRSLNGSLGLTT